MTEAKGKRVGSVVFTISIALTAICVAVIVWMMVGGVDMAKLGDWPFPHWPRVFVVVLLAIFLIASLATTEVIPWRSRSWEEWRKPNVLGTLVYMILGGVGFVVGINGIFNPPAAEQATLLETRANTERIAEAVGAGKDSLIRQKIDGVWGRPGCETTYRFALEGQAVKVTSLKSPPGAKPYNPEYSVTVDRDLIASGGERGSVIEANETVGFWPGFGVTFRYSTDGSSERLVWDHKQMSTLPLELVRCG